MKNVTMCRNIYVLRALSVVIFILVLNFPSHAKLVDGVTRYRIYSVKAVEGGTHLQLHNQALANKNLDLWYTSSFWTVEKYNGGYSIRATDGSNPYVVYGGYTSNLGYNRTSFQLVPSGDYYYIKYNGSNLYAWYRNASSIYDRMWLMSYGGVTDNSALWDLVPEGFNITFNVNGGSISISNQVALDITLPNPGTRAGYTFDGWYNGSTRIGGVGDKWKPTANATLTAKWTPITYTIRYNTYEGNLSKEKTVTYTVESPTITLENPTLDGKEFLGWSDWNDGTPKKPYTIPKGTIGDLIISANWGVDTNHNNGSGSGTGGASSGSGSGTDTSDTSHIFTGQSYVKSNRFKVSA